MKKENEQAVEAVMKQFDFVSVEKCMKVLGWSYFDTKPEVPSLDRLRMTARKCLYEVAEGKYRSCGSGGFNAFRMKGKTGEYLTLDWTPVSASNEP